MWIIIQQRRTAVKKRIIGLILAVLTVVSAVPFYADVGVARNGQTVKITPEKFEGKYPDYYQAAIKYIVYDTNNNPKVRTASLTVNKRDGLLHVPTDYVGKGAITVYAVYKDGCPHGAGEMLNYVAPTCTEPGCSGDFMCSKCINCGKVSYGHVLRRLTFTYGDVNSDGKVNISDVTALLKYLAKWDVTINTNAADVNVDSKINVSDVTTILKYLAHWEGVKLGK